MWKVPVLAMISFGLNEGRCTQDNDIKGKCQVTDIGEAEGWEIDESFGDPYSDWTSGDDAILRVSPDYDDSMDATIV
jgi:hypothetical protein